MPVFDFKRLNRLTIIYRVVQTLLVLLLAYMAFRFQQLFAFKGRPDQFFTSITAAVILQLVLIYPVYRLAWRDAGIEVEGSAQNMTGEQMAALRKKRLLGDLWKLCGVAFFIVFAFLAPGAEKSAGAPLVLAGTIFSFLLTCLMYFQCFNFSAKKRMKST